MRIIVLVDMRESNGQVLALMDDYDNIMQFASVEEAEDIICDHPLNVFPIRYIDLDE